MDPLQQLNLLTEALVAPIKEEKKFLAPVASYVERLRILLSKEKESISQQEIQFLGENIEAFFKRYRRTPNSGFYIPPIAASNNDETVRQIYSVTQHLAKLSPEEFQTIKKQFAPAHEPSPIRTKTPAQKTPCIFIGHGRSKVWLLLKEYLEKDLGLPVVAYETEPRAGESIVPILEKMLDQATFAVIVMTAEDATPEGSKRARQNVIHEAGLFQGRLGFSKAIVLLQRGCDDFSNIDGLQYIAFTEENIHEAFYGLQKTLKREKQC